MRQGHLASMETIVVTFIDGANHLSAPRPKIFLIDESAKLRAVHPV
jgi:hypothetical protein